MVLVEHNRCHSGSVVHCNDAPNQQQQPPQQLTARLLVLGHKGVGKSASIVRYTTGRFIHQYSDSTCAWLYSQTLDDYHDNRSKYNSNKLRTLGATPLGNSNNIINKYNLILPNKVELLEQKDIEFSSASNFLSRPDHHQQGGNKIKATKSVGADAGNQSGGGVNNDAKQATKTASLETNESLLFSTRVALDQQIDNALQEKQKLLNKLHWANAYIVIYAINDVSTFNKAIKYLNLIANNINSPNDNESSNSNGNRKINSNTQTSSDGGSGTNGGRKRSASSFLKSVSSHHSNHLIGPCGSGSTSSSTSNPISPIDRNNYANHSLVKPRRPILLLGNKLDLDGSTTRQVSINEGHRLALRHQTLFAEVSIAESAEQLVNIFLDLVQQVDPMSYHLSDIQSLNPYDRTTIRQWIPEIACGPVYGNIVKSRPKFLVSIAKSYRLCSSLESAQTATALTPKHAISTAKPLKASPFGRSSAGDKPSGKIDFKASFKRASMAIVGSRALARAAANAKTTINQSSASSKVSSGKATDSDHSTATVRSKRDSLEDSTLHRSLASPSSASQAQQSIASSGRNSCDSTNSISLASGYASRGSDMAARFSTSSASSAATTTTTTSTHWFSWSNLKTGDISAHHHQQQPHPHGGQQNKGQQSSAGHRRGDSIASGSPMSLSSPSSSSDPKLSSSSMQLTTLSSSDNDSSLKAIPVSISRSTRELNTKSGQQNPPAPNNNNNGNNNNNSHNASFGSRFKRPLFKYKSRRKTVAFEPPPPAVVTGASSETDNSKIVTSRLDKQSDTMQDSSLTSVHSTSTLDDINKSKHNNGAGNNSNCNSNSSKKRNISLTSVTSIKSLNLNLKSSRKDSQLSDQQNASSPAIKLQPEAHHTFQETPTMFVDSASERNTNNRFSSSLSTATIATNTGRNQFVAGPYYVLCEPEQVGGSSATCPKHINNLSSGRSCTNNSNNNNNTNNTSNHNSGGHVYGTSNNNNNGTSASSNIIVNKITESAYPVYNYGQTDYRSNLSRASTSGGSYEIEDSLDDLSASSSCGASQGNSTKLTSSQLSPLSGSLSNSMARNGGNNNSNSNPWDSRAAHPMTTTYYNDHHTNAKLAEIQPVAATVVRQATRTQLAKSVHSTLNNIGRLSNAQVAKKSFCQTLTKYLNAPSETIEGAAAVPKGTANDLARSKANDAGSNRPKRQQPGQHRVLSH